MQLAVDDDAHAHAGAHQQIDERADPDPAAEPALADGGKVGVVGHSGPIAQLLAERVEQPGAAPAPDARCQQQGAVARIEDAGAAHHRLHHVGPRDACILDHLVGEAAHRRHQRRDGARGVADVESPDDVPGEVGHRAAHPTLTDVDTDHVAGGGVVLEERRRRVAPLRGVSCRADQSSPLERMQGSVDGGFGEPRPVRELQGGSRSVPTQLREDRLHAARAQPRLLRAGT